MTFTSSAGSPSSPGPFLLRIAEAVLKNSVKSDKYVERAVGSREDHPLRVGRG